MVRDLIPTIDATYRTLANREHRAMAGLSMGAMQTLQIAPGHSDAGVYHSKHKIILYAPGAAVVSGNRRSS